MAGSIAIRIDGDSFILHLSNVHGETVDVWEVDKGHVFITTPAALELINGLVVQMEKSRNGNNE